MTQLCSRQRTLRLAGGALFKILQANAHDRPPALFQRSEVAGRLRAYQPAEAEILVGNGNLVARFVHDLDEVADRRPALVQLVGRVEVARAEAVCRDEPGLGADAPDQRIEPGDALAGRVDERLYADVVALLRPREQLVDRAAGLDVRVAGLRE